MDYLFFLSVSIIAWFLGSIAVGGAGVIFVFATSFFLPITVVPIMLTAIASVAGVHRSVLYWSSINFNLAKWLIIGTIIGSAFGAYILGSIITSGSTAWIERLLSIVLGGAGFYGLYKKDIPKFDIKESYFLWGSAITSAISSIAGVAGPMINVLYQRTRMTPAEILGTKAFNNFFQQIVKLVAYSFILNKADILKTTPDYTETHLLVLTGVSILGAIIGSQLSKVYIDKIRPEKFDKIMNISFVVFGAYFLIKSFL